MTKSRGIGRGGVRPGAGRPLKRRQPELGALVLPEEGGSLTEAIALARHARHYAPSAMKALADIVQNGSGVSRVQAARAILGFASDGPHAPQSRLADDREPEADSWEELLGPSKSN